jgi:hypothetical protein
LRVFKVYHTRKAGSAENNSPKNVEKINNFIKIFVEINKNDFNKNCRQKTNENVYPLVKFNVGY